MGDKIVTDKGLGYSIGPVLNKRGNFGVLFKGYNSFIGPVAIKIFRPANRKFLEVQHQWEREVEILNRVKHPNVVFIHDAFECDNLFYIIFERAWGNLFDLVQDKGPFKETVVIELARQLLSALHYVHSKGILHKDLTVNNILYFPNGRVGKGLFKISDFGISEDLKGNRRSFNKVALNHFKTPELVKHGYSTLQSDLYHLGLILYFCLVGQFPYNLKLPQDQVDNAILAGVPRIKAENLHTRLGDFIAVLLRRRENYRYQNEMEAWNELRKLL